MVTMSLRVSLSCWVADRSSLSLSSRNFSIPFSVSLSSQKIRASDWKIFETGPDISRKELFVSLGRRRTTRLPSKMATGNVLEALPPELDSISEPPQLFDGTTRLYISYTCPYAQRVWIARNYKYISRCCSVSNHPKLRDVYCLSPPLPSLVHSNVNRFAKQGLQEKIKLVPINLKNRPTWYKEKVHPVNKVPALEHNNEVRGESLDLTKYIDSQFEGPSLFPDDPVKQAFAEELLSYTDSFYKAVTSTFKGDGNEAGTAFDYVERALSKFEDGPFFLGQFSLVDIAYVPFIERFQLFLLDVEEEDITSGRPNLAVWIQEMNKIEAYTQTRQDPQELVERYKKRFLVTQ